MTLPILVYTVNSYYTKSEKNDIYGNQYSTEFKLESVKSYKPLPKSITSVTEELGVKLTTTREWINKYKKSPEAPFRNSRNRIPKDKKLRTKETLPLNHCHYCQFHIFTSYFIILLSYIKS